MKKLLLITTLAISAIYAKANLCDKLAGNPEDSSLQTAGVAFKDIDAPKAIKACRAEYRKDVSNVKVIYELGRAYDAKKNYHSSVKYYKLSCQKGYGLACNALGIAAYVGKGLEQNYAKAMHYYKKSCSNNNPQGCHNAAGLYQYGKGVNINLSAAKKYYKKACDLGRQNSCQYYKALK